MKLSAMFTEHTDFIRVSLRSRGAIDVNLFAQRYFNGGGHKNAAGGKSFMSMEDTLKHFEKCIKEGMQRRKEKIWYCISTQWSCEV
jgi:phosphoesterase RecJ-like protein